MFKIARWVWRTIGLIIAKGYAENYLSANRVAVMPVTFSCDVCGIFDMLTARFQ